jgi:hypothetical protein
LNYKASVDLTFILLLKEGRILIFCRNSRSFERLAKDSNRRRQQKIQQKLVELSAFLMQEKQLNIAELKRRYKILTPQIFKSLKI